MSKKMTTARKQAAAWLLAVTALALSVLAAARVYLSDQFPRDPAFVETQFESVASKQLRLEDARKAGYSDKELADFLVRRNQAEFERQWNRTLLVACAIYLILVLGIGASLLSREANSR